MTDYTYAEIAYEAYRAFTGGKSLATGQTIPEFEALPQPIKDAWAQAATTVLAARDEIMAQAYSRLSA